MKRTITICRIPEWSEAVLKTVALNGVGGSIPLCGVRVHKEAHSPLLRIFGVPSVKNTKSCRGVISMLQRCGVGSPPVGIMVHCRNGSGADC